MNTPYIPIDCDFYDLLEAASTLRQNCEIVYVDNDQKTPVTVHGRISNLYVLNSEEFLVVNDILHVRLDTLVSVNGAFSHSFGTFCT
jgi:Rho-binding antiterminator